MVVDDQYTVMETVIFNKLLKTQHLFNETERCFFLILQCKPISDME